MDLTVIIPTIPERADLLAEALASVQAQNEPIEYRIGVDTLHNGPVATVNALAACVTTEWLFRLDDDDLLDPDHCKVLSHWLDADADIVYTWCRVEGGGELHPEAQFQTRWQYEEGLNSDGSDFGGSWEALRDSNWIPCSAAIRTDLWHDLGGLRDIEEEDWDFWLRALDAGAKFRCVPAVTWTYRLNPEWEHRSDESNATQASRVPAGSVSDLQTVASEGAREESQDEAERCPTCFHTDGHSPLLCR